MNYTWSITNLKRTTSDDVVDEVHWKCVGTHYSYEDKRRGIVNLPYLDPTDSNFIAFNSLTEDDVLGWLASGVNEFDKSKIESKISGSISLQQNPPATTEATGLPW